MILAALFCAIGIAAGFLLLWRVPVCPDAQVDSAISLTVIIPARNEESNLPRLLRSIMPSNRLRPEVLVIDDHSIDNTVQVAREAGATVVRSESLPPQWTGKAWACYQGAQLASGELLLFLDADTYFAPGGLDRLIARWLRARDPDTSISLLPYHVMRRAYEQLSLIFYLLMAAGAGGFGALAQTKLFGQCLLIPRKTYRAIGGHAAVRSFILENLNFADLLHRSGYRTLCLSGRGTLQIRMFPEGFRQMSDSWTKAFVYGASASGTAVLAFSAVWITALWTAVMLLSVPSSISPLNILLVYLLFGAQTYWFARQLGNYTLSSCLLYPIPLIYYCIIFARSTLRRAVGIKTVWRGREV